MSKRCAKDEAMVLKPHMGVTRCPVCKEVATWNPNINKWECGTCGHRFEKKPWA